MIGKEYKPCVSSIYKQIRLLFLSRTSQASYGPPVIPGPLHWGVPSPLSHEKKPNPYQPVEDSGWLIGFQWKLYWKLYIVISYESYGINFVKKHIHVFLKKNMP